MIARGLAAALLAGLVTACGAHQTATAPLVTYAGRPVRLTTHWNAAIEPLAAFEKSAEQFGGVAYDPGSQTVIAALASGRIVGLDAGSGETRWAVAGEAPARPSAAGAAQSGGASDWLSAKPTMTALYVTRTAPGEIRPCAQPVSYGMARRARPSVPLIALTGLGKMRETSGQNLRTRNARDGPGDPLALANPNDWMIVTSR